MINDELISRKEVIDRLQKAQNVFLKKSPLEACGISYAREIIASEVEIPTIEKRPQGKWELIDNSGRLHRYSCSICGHQISCVPSCLQDYKGCYCGADMRGGAV